ncbi:hypothetical protein WG907_02520 [Sphingobium sp. AN558]|uniref:hypothetical protein n=1 Tax=Sphingobium sp. AN558 TaxID=3133442 RepID=UPI0030BA7D45
MPIRDLSIEEWHNMCAMKQKLRCLEEQILLLEARLAGLSRTVASLAVAEQSGGAMIHIPGNMHKAASISEAGVRLNAAGFPILARDLLVEFSDPANIIYLGVGWWGTEPWGTWGRKSAELRFCPGEGYVGGYLEVHLGVRSVVPLEGQRPTLKILANGFFLGEFSLSGLQKMVRVRIPPAAIGEGDILMVLVHSDPQTPEPVGDNPDRRTLGIGLASLLLP